MERQSFSRHLIILTLIVGLLSNVVAAGNHALYIKPKSCRARTKTRSSSASTPSTTPDNNNSTTNKPNSSAPTRHFSMTDQWMGQNFFKGWEFWDQADPTNGNVNYLSQSDATSNQLAYVQDDGTAVMRVDNSTTLGSGQNRNSVRISTSKSYNGGLFILDAYTIPYGCSVWPAFWTVGPNWPGGGEIDIVEGVNDGTQNQMTLHTGPGCSTDTKPPSLFQSNGDLLGSTCTSSGSNNNGCAFLDTSPNSYGAGFTSVGGGVFAMLWDGGGIRIWRFSRSDIPDDIENGNPNPTGWGTPNAAWASTDCPTSKIFNNHVITFDITLCGDWAGSAYGGTSCPGTCAQAVMDPSNFDNAVWKVKSVTVYQ